MELSTPIQSAPPFAFSADNRQLVLPLRIYHEGFVGTVQSEGLCTQLSPAGFSADVPAVLRVGEVVNIEMQVPGMSELLEVAARVTYRNSFHYGFYFPTLASKHREAIGRGTSRASARSIVVQ
jgi:hypothetical protein